MNKRIHGDEIKSSCLQGEKGLSEEQMQEGEYIPYALYTLDFMTVLPIQEST